MSRIVIAGGGIAGLSIAHEIRKLSPAADVTVLERRERPGGNIRTQRIDGYICEWGADGFLDNAPDTLRLVEEIGLTPRLLPSSDRARRRFIFRGGRLHEVPASPLAFLRSGLLSARGKGRLLLEPFARRRQDEDETIYGFASRRIGHEAAAVMIDAMASGIFAGDVRALSLRACFPKMWQMETDHGGLFRALVATRKRRRKGDGVGSPLGRLTSFQDGMSELPAALAASLGPAVQTGAPILSLKRIGADRSYAVATRGGAIDADAVVLAGPAADTAALLRPLDTALAGLLESIPTAPIVVVCLGFDAAALTADRGALDGFGFLVPRSERIRLLGALWESTIYPNRAPQGKALLRVILGGAHDPTAIRLLDHEVTRIVLDELRTTMGVRVRPEFTQVIKHPIGIPQYNAGHLARLQQIDGALARHPGLFLAGNSYRGVAINSCIAEAPAIARRVVEFAAARERHPFEPLDSTRGRSAAGVGAGA